MLTLKRQLVDSDLPIVTSITEAVVGLSTHAVVTKVLDSGILVDFFGGVRALIPAAEAAYVQQAPCRSVRALKRLLFFLQLQRNFHIRSESIVLGWESGCCSYHLGRRRDWQDLRFN